MIPPVLDPKTPSPGEREAFQRLKDDPLTEDWIVLHSLDVPHHRRQISGEIDFVVLVPGSGVLCIEVKAHRHIHRKEGLWFYGDNRVGEPRGPFKQASDGMHSVRKRVMARSSSLSGVVFWSAVLLPYVPFVDEPEEWHDWQVIDSRLWRSKPLAASIASIFDRARAFLSESASARWFRPERSEPTPDQCETITRILRPDFEFFESSQSRRQARLDELRRYTEEQYAALDAMERTPRVVFDGPAGTGKTLLALEAARREASRGASVLLVCFNRLLGDWLREECSQLDGVSAATLHSYMLNVAQIRPHDGASPDFWNRELPELALGRLLEAASHGQDQMADVLIVDEGQDILRDAYLDVLDISLKGGLAAGNWRFFSDYVKQSIYGTDCLPLETFLETRSVGAAVYSLSTNCRNTPRIASYVSLLGGLEPPYGRVLRPDDGIEPDLRFFRDEGQQREMLLRELQSIRDEGYRGRDIVVLSPKRAGACAATVDESPWRDRLRPVGAGASAHIGYTSIHAFKGMEAAAVIVTDINSLREDASQNLFYVAITRATDRLVILVNETARAETTELILSPSRGIRA